MTGLTKRQFMVTAAAAAAAAAAGIRPAAAQDLPSHERELYEAAKREGEFTWYSGQLNAETGEAVGRAFTERYPGIKVNVVRSTSQVAYQRLTQDMRAGVAQCDVFSSTDYSHSTSLKRDGELLRFRPKNADGMIEAARVGDPDGYFQIFYIGLYLMAYNTQKVSEADAPKSWKDLLDPKWKDQLAIGHPAYSGAIGALGVVLRKMYGEGYFKALEKNHPQIGRSSQDPVTLLNAGERTVGAGVPSSTTLLSMSRGNPLKLIYPTDGTLAVPSPSAIPKNAPHPNGAKLFFEFAAGPGYAKVTTEYFNESLRPEVAPPKASRALDQIKLITPTPDEVEAGVPEIKELWRDIFGV